jgi:hypothetical protein
MSIESGAQLSELRELVNQNCGLLNRAAASWILLARRSLDAAEANVAALCDHAGKLADASSPAECVRLQTEFLKSNLAALQRQSAGLMRTEAGAAG